MALIKCRNCGATISDKATVCPKCNWPTNQRKGLGGYKALVFVTLILIVLLAVVII